jgi:hypothetical protein
VGLIRRVGLVGGGAEEKDPFAWVGDGFSKDFAVQGETAQAERQAERQALRLASPPSRAPHPLISLDALYSELSPSPQTNNDIPRYRCALKAVESCRLHLQMWRMFCAACDYRQIVTHVRRRPSARRPAALHRRLQASQGKSPSSGQVKISHRLPTTPKIKPQEVTPDRTGEIPASSVDTLARAAPCGPLQSACGVQDLAPETCLSHRTQHAAHA